MACGQPLSDGKMGDVNVLDFLSFEGGAFYVLDRGYGPRPPRVDFRRRYKLQQTGAFFVTRAKRRTNTHSHDFKSLSLRLALRLPCGKA